MAFIEGAGDFCELTGYSIRDAKLVTIDAENVLTGYGDPQIRKCALKVIHGWDALQEGPNLAIATNNHDKAYVKELTDQLPAGIPVLSGLQYENKKTSPQMFEAAAAMFDVDPSTAVHVDDQYFSFRGARQAGFMRGILVKPFGSTEHIGVKIGRFVDTPRRVGNLARRSVTGLFVDGIDG